MNSKLFRRENDIKGAGGDTKGFSCSHFFYYFCGLERKMRLPVA